MRKQMILPSTLSLIKKNGKIYEGIQASVQKKIYINDIQLPIEVGDVFEYIVPSGQKLMLTVTDFQLYNFNSPLDHYEIEYVKKQS